MTSHITYTDEGQTKLIPEAYEWDFFRALRGLLAEYNIKQKVLCDMWDLSQSSVSQMLKGLRPTMSKSDWKRRLYTLEVNNSHVHKALEQELHNRQTWGHDSYSFKESLSSRADAFYREYKDALKNLFDVLKKDPLITDEGTEVSLVHIRNGDAQEDATKEGFTRVDPSLELPTEGKWLTRNEVVHGRGITRDIVKKATLFTQNLQTGKTSEIPEHSAMRVFEAFETLQHHTTEIRTYFVDMKQESYEDSLTRTIKVLQAATIMSVPGEERQLFVFYNTRSSAETEVNRIAQTIASNLPNIHVVVSGKKYQHIAFGELNIDDESSDD